MNTPSRALLRSIITSPSSSRHIPRQCLVKHLSSSTLSRHQESKQQHPQHQHSQESTQSANEQNSYTHFGFKTIPEEMKESLVGKVFSNVANSYDLMNDVMSGGIHRLWKDVFLRKMALSHDTKVLDVAGGTGDITFRILKYMETYYGKDHTGFVQVVDINPDMLEVGKKRAVEMGLYDETKISFQVDNAELLSHIPSESVDLYTIAFGIRNCTHVDRVLKEAHRVLKRGGRFLCLEFGHVENPVLKNIYDTYSFQLIPKMGEIFANDAESYQYLVESIRKFPPQPVFAQMIRDAGFEVRGKGYEDLTFGVAAIHEGFKI